MLIEKGDLRLKNIKSKVDQIYEIQLNDKSYWKSDRKSSTPAPRLDYLAKLNKTPQKTSDSEIQNSSYLNSSQLLQSKVSSSGSPQKQLKNDNSNISGVRISNKSKQYLNYRDVLHNQLMPNFKFDPEIQRVHGISQNPELLNQTLQYQKKNLHFFICPVDEKPHVDKIPDVLSPKFKNIYQKSYAEQNFREATRQYASGVVKERLKTMHQYSVKNNTTFIYQQQEQVNPYVEGSFSRNRRNMYTPQQVDFESVMYRDPNRPIITPIQPSVMTFNGRVKILQLNRDLIKAKEYQKNKKQIEKQLQNTIPGVGGASGPGKNSILSPREDADKHQENPLSFIGEMSQQERMRNQLKAKKQVDVQVLNDSIQKHNTQFDPKNAAQSKLVNRKRISTAMNYYLEDVHIKNQENSINNQDDSGSQTELEEEQINKSLKISGLIRRKAIVKQQLIGPTTGRRIHTLEEIRNQYFPSDDQQGDNDNTESDQEYGDKKKKNQNDPSKDKVQEEDKMSFVRLPKLYQEKQGVEKLNQFHELYASPTKQFIKHEKRDHKNVHEFLDKTDKIFQACDKVLSGSAENSKKIQKQLYELKLKQI